MMACREWGSTAAPPLVLLHAQGCHSGWWDWVGPLLADKYRVLAPDLRGHGESPRSDRYPFELYAADLEALMAQLGPCALVGHSMGAYVALLTATRGQAQVTALLLADMKTGATDEELAGLRAASERPGKAYPTLAEAVAAYRLAPPVHAVPAERLGAVAAQSFREQDGAWVAKFDRRALAIGPVEPLPLVEQLECPFLVVRGEHSLVMEREPAAALAAAGRGRLTEMAGLYHHLPLEAPEAFAQLVTEFVG